ncbi:hypothetical protein IB236_12860 [Acidovorax sp. ACV02]|uniref:hypothetical protein n=1 Tax=Acidovorax sp. ACV02 TaxID=2769310 RepID=UPI0017871A2C|nr:hypothetical protein [Acidovorax sp. ACV02]MBD9406231.1 hypothetical protein [Acidovorax sp. ACV02]
MGGDQEELLELLHTPIRPPRAGTPGEGIYLQLWQDYMAADPNRLHSILWSTGSSVGQREASVCASFMSFMGCNCGSGFTHAAEQMLTIGVQSSPSTSAEGRFLMAWALENKRYRGVNGGIRTIEAMLAKSDAFVATSFDRRVDWDAFSDITTTDYDTVECMVAWWACRDATEMRSIAKPMIEAETKRIQSRLFKAKEPSA